MSKIKDLLTQRNNLIVENKPKKINYFNLYDYLDLMSFSTYIFITPRNIGKTHSGYKLALDVYNESSEYTIWMRSSERELEQTIKDFRDTKYEWWPNWAVLSGNSVIDNRSGALIIKFVALSTAHNFASIKGVGCFGIIYDEFLPRTSRVQPSFNALTDFIKTCERDKLLTIILMANATTLNSEILLYFDIWTDIDEKTDYTKRLYYKRITSWEGAPDVGNISTSYNWASLSDSLTSYMYESEFLKDNDGLVVPLSRIEIKKWISVYRLNGSLFSVGIDKNNKYILTSGSYNDKIIPLNLTILDNFTPSNSVNAVDIEGQLYYLINGLNNKNVIFTSYDLRDEFFKFIMLYIPRKIKGD